MRASITLWRFVVVLGSSSIGCCFIWPWLNPTIRGLISFLPAERTSISGRFCVEKAIVVPTAELAAFTAPIAASGERTESQLARQSLCGGISSNNLIRDLREISIAEQIRLRFNTDDRRTMFLNMSYFGDGQYGVENAAELYFHRPASQIDAASAALLVVITQSPGRLSPLRHPENALAARNALLKRERQLGLLSDEVFQRAVHSPLLAR